ncbi:MAG: threonine synthase, partial [Pseudomonadota bacterium]
MQYTSTRGSAPTLDFEGVTLAGLASDGGLYLPQSWPRFTADEIAEMRGLPYYELAARVMKPFVAGSLSDEELQSLCHAVYSDFGHKA